MPESEKSQFKEQDEAQVSKEHWKIMLVSGMGFFTDAYDLFIIGVVMAMLKAEWHPSRLEASLVTSTALLASAVGALLFGRVADVLGRKRIYGVEVLVLAAGAIACAFSPNIIWLIIFRIILGLGIGGDYPVSATIMSEYAGKGSRGMMVSLVFAMQAAGLIVGPLLAAALLASPLSHDYVWRILLAFGAIPALAVFWARRKIAETPRFEAVRKAKQKESSGHEFVEGFRKITSEHRWLTRLIGVSVAWFVMDFAYYGNTVSSPLLLEALAPHASLLKHTLTQLAVFAAAAAPGYFVAALTMDRLGRKFIQIMGFGVMTLAFAALAVIPGIEKMVIPFLLIYGVSYFFTEFGPNATTFVYPAEVFPSSLRTTGHGIAAATGKVGGFVGVFLFPFLMKWHGLLAAESAAAIVSLIGVIVTATMLPETKGKSLEELNENSDEREGERATKGERLTSGANA